MLDIVVTEDKCPSCYLCVEICPEEVLAMNDRDKACVVRLGACIACRNCEHVCPTDAIIVAFAEWGQTEHDENVVIA